MIDSAQRDCHKFLTAFHAKLPREIRDMCYEYACTEEHPIVIWTQHPPKSLSEGPPFYIRKLQTEAGLSKAAPRTPEEASFVRDTTVAHPSTYLLNPDFCGPQVNMETREIFFGHNTWDACVLPSGDWLDPSWTSPRQLWTFFSDQFHDYFLRRDGTQLPRRMRLHVCWDLGKEQALHGASPAVCKAYMWRLHASLTELTNLQRKDLLHVEFVLHTALDLGPQTFTYNPQPWSLRKDRDFALLLAVLEDAVYAIKHAGGSVAVRHYNVAVDVVDSDVNIEDDGLDSGVRPTVLFQDLTQSFRMDEREWRQVSCRPGALFCGARALIGLGIATR